MSHPRKKIVSVPNLSGQTKILFSQPPGHVGLLSVGGKMESKKFKSASAALKWCVKEKVCFIFLPAPNVAQN
jgi:hypothetical protein